MAISSASTSAPTHSTGTRSRTKTPHDRDRVRIRVRETPPARAQGRSDIRLSGIRHCGPSLRLRLRFQGRYADNTHGLEASFRRQDDLPAPIDRQLESPLPVALLDPS